MKKNLALIAKYIKNIYKSTNNNLETLSNTNKTVDTTLRYRDDRKSRQFGNQRIVTIAGARETVGPTYDVEPLDKLHLKDDYNVFANERQHIEQPESINDTYVLETSVSNVIPDSSDMVSHRTSVSRPHPMNQMKDKVVPNNSQVKLKKKECEDHQRISSF
nr:hypothetical protein [Tanacetum cinerariifolium]